MGGKLSYPQDDIPVDRTFIVTGGNAGIGYQTTKRIAKQGGRVIIACRSEERAQEAIARMQKEHQEEVSKDTNATDDSSKNQETSATKDDSSPSPPKEEDADNQQPETTPPLKVEFMKLDLASLALTMEFVTAYKAKGYPLHVLICNAGLGLVPFQKTDDGFELQFQVNYLSHFLMTLHLLPLLRESAPNSRIVNLTSIIHSNGTFDLKNMQGEVSYDRIKFYGNSKVYQIMNMYALSRRLDQSGISIFSVHPGYVDSGFSQGASDKTLHRFVDSVTKGLGIQRNIEDGAMTSLVAALDNKYDGQTALYFKDCKPASPSALAKNAEKQEQLWTYTLECLKDHITEDLLKDLQLPEPLETKAEEAAGGTATGEADNHEEGDAKDADKESQQDEGGDKAASEEESKSVAEEINESKPEEETELKPEEETESKLEEETESKPEEETESKPDEETESKAEEETESKPDEETESKADEEIESKADEETTPKPEEETTPKPEEETTPKPEEEAESKPEEETESKSEENVESKADEE